MMTSPATFALVAGAGFLSLFAAGPTRVPSVPPNTPVGKTVILEGRWQGFDPAEGAYVYFDIKKRQITNLRFTVTEMTCTYDDGRRLSFPFTQSNVDSASVLNLLPIPDDGKIRAQIFASDSGHWFKINLAITLDGRRGTVQMFGKSSAPPAGGEAPKDSCELDTLKTPVELGRAAGEPIRQPCGYPWSPPDCSNDSPLKGDDVPPPPSSAEAERRGGE